VSLVASHKIGDRRGGLSPWGPPTSIRIPAGQSMTSYPIAKNGLSSAKAFGLVGTTSKVGSILRMRSAPVWTHG
jgi:hypothetical protein